jgi:hypothetical protein
VEHHKLLELLQPYIQAGRVEASAPHFNTPPRKRDKALSLTAAEREQLREWAHDREIPVPANNRFKRSVIEQWRADRPA